jgi:hypothetical protein
MISFEIHFMCDGENCFEDYSSEPEHPLNLEDALADLIKRGWKVTGPQSNPLIYCPKCQADH